MAAAEPVRLVAVVRPGYPYLWQALALIMSSRLGSGAEVRGMVIQRFKGYGRGLRGALSERKLQKSFVANNALLSTVAFY